MANKLSHSSASKYQACPKEYDFHYNKKLRPKLQTAALAFGTAIDAAISVLLKKEDKDPYKTFDYYWRFQEINKKREYLPESTKIVYGNSDFDADLLDVDAYEKLEEFIQNHHNITIDCIEFYQKIVEKKDKVGARNLSEVDLKYFNLCNWYALRRKGHLMIDAFKLEVLPKIIKVHAIQKRIDLKNSEGDTVTGFADMICDVKDVGTVVLDLKTASYPYEKDSVLTSPQLTLYVHDLEEEYKTRKAGYIVLLKRVKKNKEKKCSICSYETKSTHKTCNNTVAGKRCNGEWRETIRPEIPVQFIIDEIPVQTENIVIENMDFINQSIKNGIFHRNLQNCMRPWGPCPYFNVCYKNDYSEVIEV